LPTQANIDQVNELKDKLERCTIAISTDYTGVPGNTMTELRQKMRAAGVEFVVVKNTLAYLAAEAAGRPHISTTIQGPTAIAFGYDDPSNAAKAVYDYSRASRPVLLIRGAIMGDNPAISPAVVIRLGTLPAKPQLIASLLGQLQAPIQRLLATLNGPTGKLQSILQARIRQLESSEINK
jgi:large subunit ribosomal protein L10